jgi:hypothetical protein
LFAFLSSWCLLNWSFFISLVTWKMKNIFFILFLMKSKLWNQLARPLDITICIFVKKKFTNELFLSNMLLQIGMIETRQRLGWMHEHLAWSWSLDVSFKM